MEERVHAKLMLNHAGSTFNNDLIQQSSIQNYCNSKKLFEKNTLYQPPSTQRLVKDYPTLRNPSNVYTDSVINLNANKLNLKSNVISSFASSQNVTSVKLENSSNLALSLNNPYFYNLQEMVYRQNEVNSNIFNSAKEDDGGDNIKILMLLNDLKSLYTSSSLPNKVKQARTHKLNILFNYFSNFNDGNELKLDEKECLVYRNLRTNVKFSVYVDLFVKYPQENRPRSLPLYFSELFLDKILKSQVKFTPIVRYTPIRTSRKKMKMHHTRNRRKNK